MTAPHEQKLRIAGPVVVTANRTADGAVVYRAKDGRWLTRLASAAVLTDEASAHRSLAAAIADEGNATGAYVADVSLDAGGRAVPANLRERIRQHGPTFALPVRGG